MPPDSRPTSIHRVWPPLLQPGLKLRSSPSRPLPGTKSFSRPPLLLLVIYGHPKVPAGLIYLLSVIIRQIAGGKRGIILSADVNPSEWGRTGLGYGSFKVDAEIHPRSLCPLHTLWRRRSRPAAAPHPLHSLLLLLLALLWHNFTHHRLHWTVLN